MVLMSVVIQLSRTLWWSSSEDQPATAGQGDHSGVGAEPQPGQEIIRSQGAEAEAHMEHSE